MDFQTYSDKALTTSHTPNLWYHTLGLAGETGEAVEVVKKSYRPGRVLDKDKLEAELGDVLWYLNAVARVAGLTLDGIAERNLAKVCQRQAASSGSMEGWK